LHRLPALAACGEHKALTCVTVHNCALSERATRALMALVRDNKRLLTVSTDSAEHPELAFSLVR
jgi:hypothetical protein